MDFNISNTKEELEYTYEVCVNELEDIVDCLQKNSVISSGTDNYILEKGKTGVMLYFLSSDGYHVTRKDNGSRYRIKINLIKDEIRFTEKQFVDGRRVEKNYEIEYDFNKMLSIMNEIPPVDALLLKYLVKYEYVSYITGNRIRVKLDCCYAISLQNPKEHSKPFSYIEFENEFGDVLDDFTKTSLYEELQRKYMKDVSFASHNRIRKCKEYFPRQELIAKTSSNLEVLENTIKEIYINNQSKYNELEKIYNTNLRGNKPRERANNIESELKLDGNINKEVVLDIVRNSLGNQYELVKAEPRIIMDVYMDTNKDTLLKNGASFRFRKRKKEDGWIAAFKCKKNNNEIVLDRNKVRTALSTEEVLEYRNHAMPGEAASSVYDFIWNKNKERDINAKLLVIEYRDRYVVRSKIPGVNTIDTTKNVHYRMKRSELIHIIYDYVMVYDISELSSDDIDFLFRFNELNFTNNNIMSNSFYAIEIEPNKREDIVCNALTLFNKICKKICNEGLNKMDKSKYEIGRNRLCNEQC